MSEYINITKEMYSDFDSGTYTIIYERICNNIDKNENIYLDFCSSKNLSVLFLANVIGQLYGKYSCEQIKSHLKLENFPESKQSTLNLVIDNAKKYFANKALYEQCVHDAIVDW